MIEAFVTEDGIEVPAVSAEQMREVDRIAVEETGPSLFQMMENAGRNLALTVMEMMANDWKQARYLILAGTGGNGGGGICAARHLANRSLDVSLCIANHAKLGEIPKFQKHIYQSTSGKMILIDELDSTPADIILDAIIGYGLTLTPHGAALKMIQWANQANLPILSLDVPSGVDATTGESPGEFIRATKTMTLALPKSGLLPEKTGTLILADIGIPEAAFRKMNLNNQNPYGRNFRAVLKTK